MEQKYKKMLGGAVGILCVLFLGLVSWISSQGFMTMAAEQAGTIASEALETSVQLGEVQVDSWRALTVRGIDVFDKQNELIAHVDSADVKFSILSMLTKSPSEGISEIDVNGAEVNILQRADGTWNYEDLISEEESETKFTAQININDAVLKSNYNNEEIVLDDVNGAIDLANYPAISLEASCTNQGAQAEVSATIDTSEGARQTFQLALRDVELSNYLLYIPAGTIPEDTIKDISGHVDSVDIAGERVGQELFYHGQLKLNDGSFVLLEENKVENVQALVTFNQDEARVFASAESNGQKATANGKILMNHGDPIFDLTAASESFDPSAILTDIPYHGAMKFTAHLAGAMADPRVDAKVEIPTGEVSGIGFSNLTADVFYADSLVTVNKANLNIAGGSVEAAGSFDAKSYDFLGSAKLSGISASQAVGLAQNVGVDTSSLAELTGSLGGDFSFSGNANNPSDTKVFGNVKGSNINYKGLVIKNLDGSLAKQGDTITVDYLTAAMPNGGTFGIEGNVVLNESINVDFYATECDLSFIQNMLPEAPISGFWTIKGSVKGPLDNPIVRAKYAAREGSIYHQPFDQLHGSAGGSMRGVKISDFVMEHGDKTKWYAEGVMGFFGDMPINMRVDTVSARMEDIIQAVAPEQPLTGNVDNVITIKGTLKNPDITGYVHFYQGSYNGIFINGMDGDYYVKDKTITLQDFHVFTPWLDVDFNGTIDENSAINLDAAVHEVDLSRYNKNLPIPLTGTAKFNGKLTGTLDKPYFEGALSASDLTVNGHEVSNVGGKIEYQDGFVFFDNIGFSQNGGKFNLNGNVNVNNQHLRGRLEVDDGDIHSLVAMSGLKDNGITGKMDGKAIFSGTLSEPEVGLSAYVVDGALGNYALDDVMIDAKLDKRKLFINTFSGTEGVDGAFDVSGIVDLDGDVNVNASFKNIDVGAITEAAGVKKKVGGKLNTELHVTGTYAAPTAQIPLTITGLQVDGTLIDAVEAQLNVANNIIDINKFTASKTYNNQSFALNASGRVPLAALSEEMPTASNQFDVNVSLDGADLSLLPTISQYIDWAIGPTAGNMHIMGTAARPYITGSVNVDNGAFKIRDVVKPVTDFNVRLLFTGNDFTLEQCSGIMGSGSFSSSGFVHLDGTTPTEYNLDVALDKLDVDCPVFKGPITATAKVENEAMHLPDDKVLNIPKLSGRLFLENCVISLPSTLPESSDGMPDIALDYTVELGKNVRFLSSSLGDLRLAGGAYFGGTTLHPNTSGSIYVTRGTLSYLKTNFKVFEGAVKFGQADTLMPSLVLKAGTKINKTSVFLSLDGPITNMNFVLTSNPKMAEADIIQLLTLRSDYYNNKSDGSKITSMLNIGLQMTILSEVESAMRNILNLDVLTIQRDTIDGSKRLDSSGDGSGSEKNSDKNDYEVYNITLGKNISDHALVKYTQSMTTNDYSYGIDYELSDTINLTYTRDQDNAYYAGVEARFTF